MMKVNEKDYINVILTKLLKKYYKRVVKPIKGIRRITVRATEVYQNYEKNNADLSMKARLNEAAQILEKLHYVTIDYLDYSDDIVKIYLNENMITDIEDYTNKNYGMIPRDYLVEEIKQLIKEYQNKGKFTHFYCEKLGNSIESSLVEVDVSKEREILEMLAFIQSNQSDLYVREVSMLVYGLSKHFERYRYDAICSIIGEVSGNPLVEYAFNDEVLQQYHIFNVEQEICIKGDYFIELDGYILETKHFQGGISLSSRDVPRIKKVTVNTENILTIENKTAFYRFDKSDFSTLYLGGYANRYQISFLKNCMMTTQN